MVEFRGTQTSSDTRPDDALLAILRTRPDISKASDDEFERLAAICPLCQRSNEDTRAGRRHEENIEVDDMQVGWYCYECGVIAEWVIG